MRIRVEEKYSGNFCRENVDRVVPYIHITSCLSVFCPSGVGLSRILRYICFNKRYRRRYRNIRKIKFIYFDLEEINSFKENIRIDNQLVEMSESQLIKKFLIETINEHLNIPNITPEAPVENLRTSLFTLIEKVIKVNKNNPVFFIFDKTEKLLDKNDKDCITVIKSIRETFKYKLEYIFGFNDFNWLDKLENYYDSPLTSLLTQRISIIGMLHSGDFVQDLLDINTNIFSRVLIRSKKPKKEIDRLSGGYAKYYKCLYEIKDLKELNSSLPTELKIASKKLLSSLTPAQINIMKNIVTGAPIKPDRNTKILENTGIIKKDKGNISLFSPIMYIYLRELNQI